MTKPIVLCVDGVSTRNPELLGLEGECLEAQNWLKLFSSGEEAREALSCSGVEEVWVVSSEDVEPINLAATIKADDPTTAVRLVSFEPDGSLMSRAHAAHIDEVLDRSSFIQRYGKTKADAGNEELAVEVASSEPVEVEHPKFPRPTMAVIEKELVLPAPSALETSLMVLPRKQQSGLAVKHAKALIVPIVSGSGGAGKSSVAVVAAFTESKRGRKTLLIDYDLQFGDAAFMVGMPDALTIDEAIGHPDLLEREIAKQSPLTVLAAPERIETAESVVRSMPQLIDSLVDSFDVIIANTGAAWAEQHAVLLERSTVALFLVDQRASSIRACKRALELCARCGIAAGPFRFAINRCSKGAPLNSIDISSALQGFSVYELKEGGRDVEDYLGSGSVEELVATGNDFCASVTEVMEQLIPLDVGGPSPVPAKADGLFSRKRGRHANRKWGRKS